MTSYLDAGRTGRDRWYWYALGLVLVLGAWLIIGSLLTILLAMLLAPPGLKVGEVLRSLTDPGQLGPIRGYLILNTAFPVGMLALLGAVRLLHGRSIRTLITHRDRVRWSRVGQGFLVWFVLLAATGLVEFLIEPESYSLTTRPGLLLPFLALALILTPIQTTFEELLFRGYLLQAGRLVSRNHLLLSLLSGALFTLPHLGNPEAKTSGALVVLQYFLIGAYLAWISLWDGTVELAIGAHAANNLFGAAVVTFEGSIFATPALFHTTRFDPLFSLGQLVVVAAVFLLFLRRTREPGG